MDVPKPLVLDPHGYGGQMGAESEPSGQGSRHHHRFLSFSAIVAVLAAVAISVGVVVVSVLNVSARRRLAFVDHALESCSMSSRSGGSLAVGRLVWFDRKAAASRAVDLESWLNKAGAVGGGVFGTVYRASLAAEGGDLAIKNLSVSKTVPHVEDFDREVRVLAKASHPNLVSLKGYYWTPRLQLLVTDFAPNGSLQARLHERSPSAEPFSWPNRFKILQGTANGLAHLHHSFRPPIVHYDIKPSNVLLDEEFNPRVSDFGLTRLLANRFQSPLGYVAPELACGSLRVNEKCDVYGFGVLVLETVTGRRPVEYGEDDVVILNDRVKTMLEEGNVLECMDASMGECPEEEVLPMIKLALVCTSQIPSSRPSMAEVVQILQVIKTPVHHRT